MAPLVSFMLCLEKYMDQAAHLDIYFFVLLTKGVLEVKNGILQNFFPTSKMPGIYNKLSLSPTKISQRSMLLSGHFLMQSTNSISGIVYVQLKHDLQFFTDNQNFMMSLKQRKNLTGLMRSLFLLDKVKTLTQT
jgi:hypothetical protein